jgi:hypothetical protein
MIQTTSCVKKELPNFLELLITSLNVLTMKFEHAKMKHEFDLISIEVKQNQIGIEMKEKSNVTRLAMKHESNLISTKVK